MLVVAGHAGQQMLSKKRFAHTASANQRDQAVTRYERFEFGKVILAA
jgi:hypothetical protein